MMGVWMRAMICALLALLATGATAEARQCVWNKSGYTLTVRWYTPDQVFGTGLNLWIKSDALPYQEDTRLSGSGACSERDGRNIAVLSSVDWRFFQQREGDTAYGNFFFCGQSADGKDCGVTNNSTTRAPALYQYLKAYCHAYDPYVVARGTFCTTAGAGQYGPEDCGCDDVRRNVPTFFAISWPTLQRYTDVWGSIWDPQFCDDCGGPL